MVEAWRGATLETAKAVTGLSATLSGLPAGATRITVRAVDGFGSGPSAAANVDVPGEASTYASTVEAAQPSVYWRLGDSGTLVSDSSGHGRTAALTQTGKFGTGGLANDADGSVAAGVVYYGSSYDLIRAPIASGFPTGDRTLEAWVWSDNAGARVVNYGDFSVSIEERAIVVSGTRLSLAPDDDRRLTDSRWHQIVVTVAGKHDHGLPRRRTARERDEDAQHRQHRRAARRAHPGRRERPLRRGRALPDRAGRRHGRRPLRRLRQQPPGGADRHQRRRRRGRVRLVLVAADAARRRQARATSTTTCSRRARTA